MRTTSSGKTGLPSVHLYEDPSSKTLDPSEVVRYLKDKCGKIEVDVRKLPTASSQGGTGNLARRLAETKVRDLTNPKISMKPLPGEIEFERKLLLDPSQKITGLLYDGHNLQNSILELFPKKERTLNHVHIVFTNRLFGTFESDGRYHAHVSLYGVPSLISTTGIVEAPAKPKEFYILKQRYLAIGDQTAAEKLKERFRGQFIDHDDSRLTEVLKGYVMQALFYHVFGEPFCENERCRLWNARWQEEVIEAQLTRPEFCENHAEMLEELKSI